MGISRNEAVRKIDEKIVQFQKILKEAHYDNRYNKEYQSVYNEAKDLLTYLFSDAEAKRLDNSIASSPSFSWKDIPSPVDYEKELRDYKKHIKRFIIKLEDYKERIRNFWFKGEIKNEKKFTERALLLMRFYERNKIYKIGKEMDLSYFSQFKDYEEMSYHRGALEISTAMTDENLLKLTKENPPNYGHFFGGFQGNYYTATENGNLQLASSWESVRKNIQLILERWDETAYGFLQAIINKGGSVIERDITAEIVKILGPGYPWQDLLPLLKQRKLVFKRYGGWEMPQEIIPVVREELLLYKRLTTIFPDIIQTRRHINLVFKQKFKTALFKDAEVAMDDIQKSCMNEGDFNNRIQALSTLLDKMEKETLKKCINSDSNRSVKVLEEFLNITFPNYDKNLISNFRNIIKLRSKKHPIHSDDPIFIRAVEYFGFHYPPDDWEKLWRSVLNKYLESLELLLTCLKTID